MSSQRHCSYNSNSTQRDINSRKHRYTRIHIYEIATYICKSSIAGQTKKMKKRTKCHRNPNKNTRELQQKHQKRNRHGYPHHPPCCTKCCRCCLFYCFFTTKNKFVHLQIFCDAKVRKIIAIYPYIYIHKRKTTKGDAYFSLFLFGGKRISFYFCYRSSKRRTKTY